MTILERALSYIDGKITEKQAHLYDLRETREDDDERWIERKSVEQDLAWLQQERQAILDEQAQAQKKAVS